MTNHRITGSQMQCILIMFWTGSVVIAGASKETKQDYWISILITMILFLPMILLYTRLIKLYPGKNLYEITIEVFGKVFGRITCGIYVINFIFLCAMVAKTFSLFVRTESLQETPLFVISIFMLLTAVLSVVNGPENIGRMAKYTFKVLTAFVLLTLITGIKDMKFSNLLPIMNTDFKSILNDSFSLFALPFAEAIICLSFFSALDTAEEEGKNKSVSKIFFKAAAVTILLFAAVAIRNVLILGVPASQLFYFPSYNTVSVISLGDFFSRFEVLIGIDLMLAGFLKSSVCLYSASLGCSVIFNIKDQKRLVVPCALIIITLTQMVYTDVQENFNWIPFYRIFVLPYEIILPAATLIGAEIRYRIKNASSPQKPSPSE